MAEILCGVCQTGRKQYKCPRCSMPYCSLACFQTHKPMHEEDSPILPIAQPSTPDIPQPPPPPPIPKYLKQKTDFSVLSSNPRYEQLLKTHPTLLSSLQRIYATTIEPDPDEPRQQFRGGIRGRADRGRGRGRGRGDRGRGRSGKYGGYNEPPRWTQKKGDVDAMKMLKGFREGKKGDEEKEAMAEFVKFIEETFDKKKEPEAG